MCTPSHARLTNNVDHDSGNKSTRTAILLCAHCSTTGTTHACLLFLRCCPCMLELLFQALLLALRHRRYRRNANLLLGQEIGLDLRSASLLLFLLLFEQTGNKFRGGTDRRLSIFHIDCEFIPCFLCSELCVKALGRVCKVPKHGSCCCKPEGLRQSML